MNSKNDAVKTIMRIYTFYLTLHKNLYLFVVKKNWERSHRTITSMVIFLPNICVPQNVDLSNMYFLIIVMIIVIHTGDSDDNDDYNDA